MKKFLSLVFVLSLLLVPLAPAASASTASLPVLCSLHEFSTRFSLAAFFYNTDHEFLSEYMESTTGTVKNSITTYFPEANAYVIIYMPVGVTDICEITVHSYGGSTAMQSMHMMLLIYETVMAAGGFSTTQEVSDSMNALGMLENFDVGNDGSIDYQGIHLYWLMSDFLGFVFSITPSE